MTVEQLSPKELLSLCLHMAVMALARLRLLSRLTERGDEPLRLLFDNLAGEMETHLLEIERFDARGGPSESLAKEDAERIAGSLLPSLLGATGGRSLDRESGIYMAECLGEDIADFYAALARRAVDQESLAFFTRSRQSVEARLTYLRHVLL